MQLSKDLAYSIMKTIDEQGVYGAVNVYAPALIGHEGDALVEVVGFLYHHGLSHRVISALIGGIDPDKLSRLIQKSGRTPPNNVIGIDGRVRRSNSGPGRPVSTRSELLLRDLESALRRIETLSERDEEIPGEAAVLAKEVGRYGVS